MAQPGAPDPSAYPAPPVTAGHVERAPRRVRGVLGGRVVFDTTRALYHWEWPFYPQYLIPEEDVEPGALVPAAEAGDADEEPDPERLAGATHDLVAGGLRRPGAARVRAGTDGAPAGMVRFAWEALDAWYEEEERVFVHPRSPYVRVDALRSSRSVRVELGGVVLAESDRPVAVFETGLPTRHYLEPTGVRFEHLVRSTTETSCPYKGRTSATWDVVVGGERHRDLAWSYDFPTRQLLPVAGLIAFYDEKVDVILDGERTPRPRTHFGD